MDNFDSKLSSHKKRDILLRLEYARKSNIATKNSSLIVTLGTDNKLKGRTRMLSKSEIEKLKATKKLIAIRVFELLIQAIKEMNAVVKAELSNAELNK